MSSACNLNSGAFNSGTNCPWTVHRCNANDRKTVSGWMLKIRTLLLWWLRSCVTFMGFVTSCWTRIITSGDVASLWSRSMSCSTLHQTLILYAVVTLCVCMCVYAHDKPCADIRVINCPYQWPTVTSCHVERGGYLRTGHNHDCLTFILSLEAFVDVNWKIRKILFYGLDVFFFAFICQKRFNYQKIMCWVLKLDGYLYITVTQYYYLNYYYYLKYYYYKYILFKHYPIGFNEQYQTIILCYLDNHKETN